MTTTLKPLFSLTAGDLMSCDIVAFDHNLSVRDAARRLQETGIHGAPVVDDAGVCVGVLSVTDFLRRRMWPIASAEPPAKACSYQKKVRLPDGRESIACQLPLGACSAQRVDPKATSGQAATCALPHCIFVDWQVVELDELPAETVRQFMTADPVVATADRGISDLARMMLDAGIHRVIIVDLANRPVGVVSSTDLLAALTTPDESAEQQPA